MVPEAAWARAAQVEARVRLPAAAEVDPARAVVDRAVDQRVRAVEKAVIPAVGDFPRIENRRQGGAWAPPFSRARAGPHKRNLAYPVVTHSH